MFAILENFRESIPFILLGNIASSLKFELMACFFFRDGTWYAWTFSLPSTWPQLPWWKIVRCFKSGLHCTRLYIAFKAQKLLEVSEVFWSFTCIFKSKLLCTHSRLTKSEGRNIKLRCYRESRNRDTLAHAPRITQIKAAVGVKVGILIANGFQMHFIFPITVKFSPAVI